jgi:hypothetical protein
MTPTAAHTCLHRLRRTHEIFVAAIATCSAVATAPWPAPTAHADCASFSGYSIGIGCTSSFGGMAIAIGTNATATANGFLSTATAIGTNVEASAYGTFNMAVAYGIASAAVAGNVDAGDVVNMAITLGDGSSAVAEGISRGFANIATDIGNHNTVFALGVLETAFAVFGTDNTVTASPGPLALAGSIGQTGAHITKTGPGLNINGFTVGGASATPTAAPAGNTKAHAVAHSHRKTT